MLDARSPSQIDQRQSKTRKPGSSSKYLLDARSPTQIQQSETGNLALRASSLAGGKLTLSMRLAVKRTPRLRLSICRLRGIFDHQGINTSGGCMPALCQRWGSFWRPSFVGKAAESRWVTGCPTETSPTFFTDTALANPFWRLIPQ